jgi:putative N6-adenine-specific DNA methylase
MAELELLATCPAGLEAVLADELDELSFVDPRVENGAVRVFGDERSLVSANYSLRTASRVLLSIARSPCASFDGVYEACANISWLDWFTPKQSFSVSAVSRDSNIDNNRFLTLRIKDAIVDVQRKSRGARSSVEKRAPAVQVYALVHDGYLEVSLDTTGRPLHERGYRKETGEAPLRETLAAALLRIAGMNAGERGAALGVPGHPLLDPFCGSGTIAIEAAMMILGIAPGSGRTKFGFMELLPFTGSGARLLREAKERAADTLPTPGNRSGPRSDTRVLASDKNADVVDKARENARRAGVADAIRFGVSHAGSAGAEFAIGGTETGTIVSNLPYGRRSGTDASLAELYADFGDELKRNYRGWTAWLLTGNRQAAKRIGLRPSDKRQLKNGDIDCRFAKFELY